MLQSFKLAIKSIIANKMRSFLTMLGLIIGVSAVVILVSVMMGYMNNMVKSFMDMGANTISVNLVNMPARQALWTRCMILLMSIEMFFHK